MDEIGGAPPGLPPGVVMVGMRAPQLPAGAPAAAAPATGSTSKGLPWSPEEHEAFIVGLQKFGKGNWRSISRTFVPSRTPTQVASHAQKYFLRAASGGSKRKSRFSGCYPVGEPSAKLQRTSSPTDSSSPQPQEHAAMFSPPPQHHHPSAQPHPPQQHHLVYTSPYPQPSHHHLSPQLLQQPVHPTVGSAPPHHSITTTPVTAMGMPVPGAGPSSAPLPPGTLHAPQATAPMPPIQPLPMGSVAVSSMPAAPYYAHHPQPQQACVAPAATLGGTQPVYGLPCLSLPPAHTSVGGLLGMHAGIPLHATMGGGAPALSPGLSLLQPQLVGLPPQHAHKLNPQMVGLHQLGQLGPQLSQAHNPQQQQLGATAAALPPSLLQQLLAQQQQQQQQGLYRLEPLGAHAPQLQLPQQQQPQPQVQQLPQQVQVQQVQPLQQQQQQPRVEEVEEGDEQEGQVHQQQQQQQGVVVLAEQGKEHEVRKEGKEKMSGEEGVAQRKEGREQGKDGAEEQKQEQQGEGEGAQEAGRASQVKGEEGVQEGQEQGEGEAKQQEGGVKQEAVEGAQGAGEQQKGAAEPLGKEGEKEHEVGQENKPQVVDTKFGPLSALVQATEELAGADCKSGAAEQQQQQQQQEARKPVAGADKIDSPSASDASHASSCSENSSHDSTFVAAALKAGLCRPEAVKGNPQQTGSLLAFLQPLLGTVAPSSSPPADAQPQEQPPQQEKETPQLQLPPQPQSPQQQQQKEEQKEQQQSAPRPSAFRRVAVPSNPAGVHSIPLSVRA